MSLACRILSHRVSLLGCAALVSAALVSAQAPASSASVSASGASGWSSSQSGQIQLAEGAAPARPGAAAGASAALPSAPKPAAQDDNTNYSGWSPSDIKHRLTIEAGGGAVAPAGDKQYITWGGGFTLGAGVNFSQKLAMMIEYQFLDNKIPGAIIAESGTTGGHYHIWSFTVDPVFDLFPKSANDVYVTGGGGFYRKTTNFTVLSPQQFCDYFYYYCGTTYSPQTVGKLSSNQGGFNIGGGYQHRFGGMYGLSRTRFFAEVRYLDVFSPAVKGRNPSGGLSPVTIGADTKLMPIMIGIRW